MSSRLCHSFSTKKAPFGASFGAGDEASLGLLAVRKLSFVLFLLREIVTHYSFLTGTAFRSLTFTPALPKSAELAKAVLSTISVHKKDPS